MHWDQDQALGWNQGIHKLLVRWKSYWINHGATYTTTFCNPTNPLLYQLPISTIATTLPGQNYVDVLAPSNEPGTHYSDAGAISYPIGSAALIGSFAISGSGYPQNIYNRDFGVVTSRSGERLFFERQGETFIFEHRADYPDIFSGDPAGKARIYSLDHKSYARDTSNVYLAKLLIPGGQPVPWDVDHEYQDITAVNVSNAGPDTVYMCGRRIVFTRCQMRSWSPSICETFKLVDCPKNAVNLNEPDKLVRNFICKGTEFQELPFQSSFDNVRLDDCNVHGTLVVGAHRNFLMTGGSVATLSISNGQGGSGGTSTFVGVDVRDYYDQTFSYMGGYRFSIGTGTGVTYANGTIRVTSAADIGAEVLFYRPPGTLINLCHTIPGGPYSVSSDIGTGIITQVRADTDGSILIDTTLPYATLPSWASGAVYVKTYERPTFINCTGCEAVRQASMAYEMGRQPGEYYSFIFGGKGKKNFSPLVDGTGIIERIRVSVITPSSVSGARFRLDCGTFDKTTMGDPQTLTYGYDLSSATIRDWSGSTLTGKVGSDAISLDSTYLTNVPQDRFFQSLGYSIDGYDPETSTSSATNALFQVEVWIDTGLLGRRRPAAGVSTLKTLGRVGQMSA